MRKSNLDHETSILGVKISETIPSREREKHIPSWEVRKNHRLKFVPAGGKGQPSGRSQRIFETHLPTLGIQSPPENGNGT